MKSARAAVVLATLGLVLVPFVVMLTARAYEWWLTASHHTRLAQIAAQARLASPAEMKLLAHTYGVMFRVVSADGRVDEVGGEGDGDAHFWFQGPFERLTQWLGGPVTTQTLAHAEQTFPPLLERGEIRDAQRGDEGFAVYFSASGETAAMVVATPMSGGRVLTVTKASHRSVRRLLSLRREMARLAVYQAVAALAVGLFLSRWLVRPLHRLARSVARYPGEPLAGDELLKRPDEIGQLARAVAQLAASLEARRREAVERAADVAHEFKNPLATIAAAAEHLGTTRTLTEEKRQMLSAVSAGAAVRLSQATEMLLALARLEAELPSQPREWVDYRAFLSRLISEYRSDTRHSRVELMLSVEPRVGQVHIVRAAWEQAVRNLIENALCQTMTGGRVEVLVTLDTAGSVVTTVRDDGPGVSIGNRDKIFRRFFTDRPESAPKGTGLGLSIVRTVAEAHGGSITLVPQEGRGASFLLRL